MRLALIIALLCCSAFASKKPDEPAGFPDGQEFPVIITNVESLPTKPVGFSRTALPLYLVKAESADKVYTLACVNQAPEAGTKYVGVVFYVTASHSWLHSWPVNRSDIALPDTMKKKGQLYKVLMISQPNGPWYKCDISKEAAIQEPK